MAGNPGNSATLSTRIGLRTQPAPSCVKPEQGAMQTARDMAADRIENTAQRAGAPLLDPREHEAAR